MAKIFEKIAVEYPPEDLCTYPEYKGKPYFSIQYEEDGEHFIGFGTYKPEVFSQYLSEYFVNQPTCEDAISRKEVCKQINRCIGSGEYRHTNATDYLAKRIVDLPSVTPIQKWIPVSEGLPKDESRDRA